MKHFSSLLEINVIIYEGLNFLTKYKPSSNASTVKWCILLLLFHNYTGWPLIKLHVETELLIRYKQDDI